MNLKHIAIGWAKTLNLIEASKEDKIRSQERIMICTACPHAKSSSFLKFLRGNGHNIAAVKCGLCGCPINEKTLVKEEKCKDNRW